MNFYKLILLFIFCFFHAEMKAEIPQDWGVSTVMGVKRRIQDRMIFLGGSYKMPSEHFKHGSLPIYISRSSKTVAPLVILFPGIFGIADDFVNKDSIDYLQKRDLHIVSIPNFFNKIYIRRGPLYQGENVSQLDLQIAREAIDWAILKIGKDKISTINLMGESLGTFVALGVYQQDSKLITPLINGSIVLLFPPLDLHHTIKNFDQIIHDYKQHFNDCSRMSWLIELLKKGDSEALYSQNFNECTKAFLLHAGFVDSIGKVSREFNPALKKPEEMNFTKFLKSYNPKLLDSVAKHSPEVILATWLDAAILKNPRPIKIISAEDDFLNWGMDWKTWSLERNYKELDMTIFKNGGHCGPLGYPEGKEVISEFLTKHGW